MNTFTKATLLALGAAVISGVNGFLTKPALSAVGDPVVFTFLKNMVVVFIFLVFFVWSSDAVCEIRTASKWDRWMLLAIGIVGGGIPFILYFMGLSMVSAVTAAFIQKTLFVWVAVLAALFLGERFEWLHMFALGLLFFGVILFQVPVFRMFGMGELLILSATFLWAIENIIVKKVSVHISSFPAASARMGIGLVVIFAFVLFGGKTGIVTTLSFAAWGWVFLTGALLAGYVSCWYRALSLAPATFVASLLVPATFITGTLSALFVTHSFSLGQVAGWFCLILGISLLPVGAFFSASSKKSLESSAVGNQG